MTAPCSVAPTLSVVPPGGEDEGRGGAEQREQQRPVRQQQQEAWRARPGQPAALGGRQQQAQLHAQRHLQVQARPGTPSDAATSITMTYVYRFTAECIVGMGRE